MEQYRQRRQRLGAQLPTNSLVVLPGATVLFRNNDAEHLFRQDSDFYYLTGFKEDSAWLFIEKLENNELKSTLFCLPKDPALEVWTGKRVGPEQAPSLLLVDASYTCVEMAEHIPKLIQGKQHLYFPFSNTVNCEQKIFTWLEDTRKLQRKANNVPEAIHNILPIIHDMRVVKDAEEIKLMRQAANISVAAHQRVMQVCQPDMYEYQLEAEFAYHCRYHGCNNLAYTSIVASGDNANTLHYVTNDKQIAKDDLILIDAGGEYEYYAADITRTFPASGKFTSQQAEIYKLVLQCQREAIQKIKPGVMWNTIQDTILTVMVTGLVKLGILAGDVKELIANHAYRQFYMHGSGHWLGLDVHDAGRYKNGDTWRELQENMVLTVEPGIYISADNQDVAEQWRGIGVRIEDNVLVTATGYEILTKDLPVDLEDIERLCNA